jgi:hypothetical protein
LGGTAFKALQRFLDENPQVRTVISCLDNDSTGDRRSEKMIQEFTEKGYEVRRESPLFKDYSDDLLYIAGSIDYNIDVSFDDDEIEAELFFSGNRLFWGTERLKSASLTRGL